MVISHLSPKLGTKVLSGIFFLDGGHKRSVREEGVYESDHIGSHLCGLVAICGGRMGA